MFEGVAVPYSGFRSGGACTVESAEGIVTNEAEVVVSLVLPLPATGEVAVRICGECTHLRRKMWNDSLESGKTGIYDAVTDFAYLTMTSEVAMDDSLAVYEKLGDVFLQDYRADDALAVDDVVSQLRMATRLRSVPKWVAESVLIEGGKYLGLTMVVDKYKGTGTEKLVAEQVVALLGGDAVLNRVLVRNVLGGSYPIGSVSDMLGGGCRGCAYEMSSALVLVNDYVDYLVDAENGEFNLIICDPVLQQAKNEMYAAFK
ncbi:hypothetical protein BG000_002684, partial [Podila horticola]